MSGLVGLDEVGRGCWAGPLVAGAVLLRQPITGLKDSKQLSARQRNSLSLIIYEQAVATGLGWVFPVEIDRLGLTASVGLAMRRAIEQIKFDYNEVIIDGNFNFFPTDQRAKAIIKADATVPAVSAASIIAKVARDRYMAIAAEQYPGFGFERHVGYGTAEHLLALKNFGITPEHRQSYRPIRTIMGV